MRRPMLAPIRCVIGDLPATPGNRPSRMPAGGNTPTLSRRGCHKHLLSNVLRAGQSRNLRTRRCDLRFQRSGGPEVTPCFLLPGLRQLTVDVASIPELRQAEFATVIESDRLIGSDRRVTWGPNYGSHAETSVTAHRTHGISPRAPQTDPSIVLSSPESFACRRREHTHSPTTDLLDHPLRSYILCRRPPDRTCGWTLNNFPTPGASPLCSKPRLSLSSWSRSTASHRRRTRYVL